MFRYFSRFSCMLAHVAKYVPDTFTNRWVIYATHRAFRPHENGGELKKSKIKKTQVVKKGLYNYSASCPFCYTNEYMTPPEVFRWSNHSEQGPADHEWLVRVIPNKFPIADFHEVVIHSPDHKKELTDLPEYHSEIILKVFLQRFQALSKKGTVLIFTNKGLKSGESLTHPHSQIVVLPRQIKLDVISLQPVNNVIEQTSHYTVYCPDFSQWPYEMWISLNRFHDPSFVDRGTSHFGSISEEELSDLAQVLRRMLMRMKNKFPSHAYNYYIHPYSPWYLRLIPRFVTRAGFELGTGLYVNIKDPAEAAGELKS